MSNENNQVKFAEATEIIELACGQLELLAQSFDCIAHIADSGRLVLDVPESVSVETIN